MLKSVWMFRSCAALETDDVEILKWFPRETTVIQPSWLLCWMFCCNIAVVSCFTAERAFKYTHSYSEHLECYSVLK